MRSGCGGRNPGPPTARAVPRSLRPVPTLELDGRTVAYVDSGGDGSDRPPVLCLHGWTGSKEDYDLVVPRLAEDRRVVVPDLPGHQGSDGFGDEAAYGLAPLGAWVLRLLDALELDEVHLVAHSHGGLVAQRLAAVGSHRLRSLVLVGTGLGAVREEAAEVVAQTVAAARAGGMAAAWEASRIELPAAPGVAEVRAAREAFTRARFHALEPEALIGMARNLIGSAPVGAPLRGLDVPALVVTGEYDHAWLAHEQGLLARTVRRARHVVLIGGDHTPQVTSPEVFVDVVARFLREADADRTSSYR